MKDSSFSPPFEETEIRCPRLGGPVTFGYCRIERQQRPCQRAIKCWSGHFDVAAFFRERLTPDEFDACFLEQPLSKVVTLIELIEQARKTLENKQKQ
ncbi:MAG: hypothetical protein HY913_24495 [Desulfomonile tiedjei]|nr:hypothetical protein [Desulfomonile tiedjei]